MYILKNRKWFVLRASSSYGCTRDRARVTVNRSGVILIISHKAF